MIVKPGDDPWPNRRSSRLRSYDYSQPGAYFITMCAKDRQCLFGRIADRRMVLNDAGHVVQAMWDALPNGYPHVELDCWTIMPNHVHGIIMLAVGAGYEPARKTACEPSSVHCLKSIDETGPKIDQEAGSKPARMVRHGLPEIVRALKTSSSRRINRMRGTPGAPVWQRNYYERVIRNDSELNRIREYIIYNPARWEMDRENPNAPIPNTREIPWED